MKIIQIAVVDPGYQTQYLYEDGSIWVRQVELISREDGLLKSEWKWSRLELPRND